MDHHIAIPSEVLEKGTDFFSGQDTLTARRLIEKGNLNISFQKGSPERYFVISGIVFDGEQAQSKVSYKAHEGALTSSCSCHRWTQEGHCPHTAALFYKFHLNQQYTQAHTRGTLNDSLHAKALLSGQGVHVRDYGDIIVAANKLEGSRPNSTYSSLQYILTNNKIVHFPMAQQMKGQLALNLVPAKSLERYDNYPNVHDKYCPVFNYCDEEGNSFEKISLFESLYIFDWDSGQAWTTGSDVRDFIKELLRVGTLRPLNDFLQIIAPLQKSKQVKILIGGEDLETYPKSPVKVRFNIGSSQRRSFLDLNLELHNERGELITPPSIFKVMTNEGGFLSGFRSKNDAYEFINVLVDSLKYQHVEYKKHLYGSQTRAKIIDSLEFLQQNELALFTSPQRKEIHYIESQTFIDIFIAFFECFQASAIRFSHFRPEEFKTYFQLPKNQLLEGVASFHKRIQKYQIPIFYNQQQVRTWNANMRFERNRSNLDWFEVKLVIDQNDLEVIQNAKFSDSFLISDQGLILLDTREKELLKFMKKYTKHEANDSENEGEREKSFQLTLRRSRIFELFELKKYGIEGALTQEEEDLCENLLNMKQMPKFDLSSRYMELARPYQITGYNWLRFLYENKFGACLADDMGLGKTLQTIMFLQEIESKFQKVLIVCPVSILINWQNEIQKFSELDVHVYYGSEREAPKESTKIILTSYGVMKKESWTTFEEMQFDILIMDEVQHLKNIRSQGAQAARNLKADFRICLTGTPVENDLSEFYNIMDLSIPGVWGESSFFRSSSNKRSRLLARQTVKPFILRRTKEQVLTELPEKVENHVYLDFQQEERQQYLSTLGTIRKEMEQPSKGRKYAQILKGLLQLRQLCLWQKNPHLRSSKVDFLMENLDVLIDEGHKVLVFSQFTTYLDIIQNKVRERSYKFARIDGTQTLKKRQQEVDRFQEGDAQVFLISLKAGGVGLNLTAASYIFLMDPWWNPAVENQAIDRAYRIGQENKLTVYRPIIKDSVEEKVLILQNTKKELFKDLMAEDDQSFFDGKLSMEDFHALLSE